MEKGREKKGNRRFLGRYDGYKHAWLRGAREFAVMLLAVAAVFNVCIGTSRVSGDSMEPALRDGEMVFFVRMVREYERGDIVFARMPSGEYYVKRIVAVAGDVVDLKDGVLYVNGVAEGGEYVKGSTQAQDGIVEYPYTVGEGRYFMAGDNREASLDSRSFGALLESQIRGRLILR